MQQLNEAKLVDNLIALRMLRLFTVKYEDTQAYKLGIINEKGEQLIKMRNFVTNDQSNAYTLLHRLVFRLRGLLEKVPFVKSRLANYAAALLLVREKIVKEEEFFESDDVLLEKLDMAEHRPMYSLCEQQVRKAWEDAPLIRQILVLQVPLTVVQLLFVKRKERHRYLKSHHKLLQDLVKVKRNLKDGINI